MNSLFAAVHVLADDPPADIDPSTGKGPEWGKAAPIGLLVILLLGIAMFFLMRSMVRNLKKVPESFDSSAVDGGDRSPAIDGDDRGTDAIEVPGPDDAEAGSANLVDKGSG